MVFIALEVGRLEILVPFRRILVTGNLETKDAPTKRRPHQRKLVEGRKIIMLHVRDAFKYISLPHSSQQQRQREIFKIN